VLQVIAPQKILVNPLVHNKADKAHMKMGVIAQLILNVLLELAHQMLVIQTVLVSPHMPILANVLLILTVVQVIAQPLILVKTHAHHYKQQGLMILDVIVLQLLIVSQELAHLVFVYPIAQEQQV
jgi:hypothetical protein